MYNPNRSHILRSALQKSIRCCEINPSRYFARQLMDIGVPGSVFNRLMIIAAEDVGLADPTLLIYVRQCLDSFENLIKNYKIKKRDAVKIPQLRAIVDRAVIAAAISWKSRLLPMLSFLTLFDIHEKEKFNKNLNGYLNLFAEAIKNKDEKQALYYAYIIGLFLNSMDRLLAIIQKHSKRRNEDLIQEWIKEYMRGEELLMLAGSVVLLCRDLSYHHGGFKNVISQYISSPITAAVIPDRAYDKHTSLGKRKGRGLEHFFREGATIKKERFPNVWEKSGEDAYLHAEKVGLEKASKMIEEIKKKCQATTILVTI